MCLNKITNVHLNWVSLDNAKFLKKKKKCNLAENFNLHYKYSKVESPGQTCPAKVGS